MRRSAAGRRLARCGAAALAVWALAVWALAGWPQPAAAQTAAPLEAAVKATYVYKFLPFVQWPSEAFPTSDSAVHLCVVGADQVADLLEQAVRGENVDGRPILVQRLPGFDPAFSCHAMYVMGGERSPAAEVLRAAGDRPILTFTDNAAGDAARGIVHFVLRQGRVRFEIDNRRAQERGLQISAKVLSLAVSVIREETPPGGPTGR